MVGKTFTYLLGSDAAALLFNSKNEDLNAEDVYSRLTTPVFGRGVAYDVPNAVCILKCRPVQKQCSCNAEYAALSSWLCVMGFCSYICGILQWYR